MTHMQSASLAYMLTEAMRAAAAGKAAEFRTACKLAFEHETMPRSGRLRAEVWRAGGDEALLSVARAIGEAAGLMESSFSAHERVRMLYLVWPGHTSAAQPAP